MSASRIRRESVSGSGKYTKQIETMLGNPAPLGVSCVKEEFCTEFYNFAVFVPGALECELKIYDFPAGKTAGAVYGGCTKG